MLYRHALKGLLAAVVVAALVPLLATPLLGQGNGEEPLPTLSLDEFLFSVPDALEANVELLGRQVREGAGAATQALYGIQLLGQGNHLLARKHCTEALARGMLFEPIYCMSIISYREGQLKEASQFALQAVELRPGVVAAYLVLANVHKTLKDKEGMVRAVEMGIAAIPERAAFWEWELAKMFEELGDLDGALQCIGVLSRISAHDPKVFTQAGDWLRRKGQLAEAAQMYRFALSKASWYVPAALSLMETYQQDKQWTEIHRIAPTLLENPQLAGIHDTLRHYLQLAATTMLEQELAAIESRHGINLAELSSFDNVEPARASAILFDAASVCLRYSGNARALPLLRKADSLTPSSAEVLLALGQVLSNLGQMALATSYVGDSLLVIPAAEAYLLAASLAQKQGQSAECVEHATKALEFRPDWVKGILLLARCHRAQRQSDAELQSLERGYSVNPENADVLAELAQYYLHMTNGGPQAMEYLERLFNLVPADYRVCLKLAGLQEEADERLDALATYSKCIEAIPPFEDELRLEAYKSLAGLVEGVRSVDAIVAALRRTCDAGMSQGCADLAGYAKGTKKVARLKAAAYRPKKRKKMVGELERLGPGGGDFLVLGLGAPGFAKLPRQEKIFLYYMTRAAIAGDELLYMQNHRHALVIKRLLERLFVYRKYLPADQVAAIHHYLKYVWLNHGNYDHRAGVKFVPARLTRGTLKESMDTVFARGEQFEFIPGVNVDEKLAYLDSAIFDQSVEPQLTVTLQGADVVAASAVNHYDPGVTQAMLDGLDDSVSKALNVRFALRGGELLPQQYKVGGLGSEHIQRIVYFLGKALPYASSEEQRKSLEELISFYQTGDEEAFRRHSIAWLKTKGSTDYINGLVEQLKDPRGVIGNFEGMAAFVSDASKVDALADAAAYFEAGMPWPEQYKRDKVVKPVSNVASVLIGTGDMGPVPWAGYNLPNYADIRSTVGSKNVIFLNIITARSPKELEVSLKEFYLPEYRPLVRKYGPQITNWVIYMHEIIGHGSGKPAPDLKDDPRNLIGRSFSALEEARADLVALYFIPDDKLVQIGAFPKGRKDEVLLAAYAQYFQGFLAMYRRFQGEEIKGAHWKGRQLILTYLIAGGESGKEDYGMEIVEKEGHFYVQIADAWKARAGIGKLLERVQVIKSMGDKEGAEQLIDRFGTHYEQKYKASVEARSQRIGLAKQTAYVFPRLQPVVDRKGKVVDVRILNDEDLTAQQLRFSRLQQGLDLD